MIYNTIGLFRDFLVGTPAVPAFYWNVKSQEERIKKICCEIKKLEEYADAINGNSDANHEAIAELERLFEEFIASGFDDYYKAQVIEWVNNNLNYIFDKVVKQVYFGLTDDGHFIAYIPDSWSDIVFSTGADCTKDTYGHLILKMDVDSPYNVDQTPEPANWI